MDFTEIKNKIQNFDYKSFSWTEAVNDAKGKSSGGLFITFFYGIVLIILTLAAGIAYFVKWIEKDNINNIFIFVGIQMPIALGYLWGHKKIDEEGTTSTKTD